MIWSKESISCSTCRPDAPCVAGSGTSRSSQKKSKPAGCQVSYVSEKLTTLADELVTAQASIAGGS